MKPSFDFSWYCCAGEDLVIAVKNDPKFPHATFKCTLCDCYFNDDYARKGHVKGRRHRLNYKKMYQPDLYVEPTKQQKKEMEKRKRMFEQRRGQRMRGGMMNGRGGGAAGQASPQQQRDQPQQVDLNELRRQEAAALAQFHAQKNVSGHQHSCSTCTLCAFEMEFVTIEATNFTKFSPLLLSPPPSVSSSSSSCKDKIE